MDDIRETVMDLQNALLKLQEWLEDREAEPVRESGNGVTWHFRCVCGQPVGYPDKYCRECGRKILWNG